MKTGLNITRGYMVILLMALLASGSAFAGNKDVNKGSLKLLNPTEVGGKQLPAGSYQVEWTGSGDQVQVTIVQNNKNVASTSGRVVQVQYPPEYNNAVVNKSNDGSMSLSTIQFRGKKFELQINNEGGGAGGAAGAGR